MLDERVERPDNGNNVEVTVDLSEVSSAVVHLSGMRALVLVAYRYGVAGLITFQNLRRLDREDEPVVDCDSAGIFAVDPRLGTEARITFYWSSAGDYADLTVVGMP